MLNNSPTIQLCRNIETAVISNIQYNLVVDRSVGVLWYDSNWNYQSTFLMPYIFYGIVAINFFYFTPIYGYGIIKTSLISPTVIKSYGSVGKYRGLYYDSIGSKIIAAGCDINAVDILDLDLNFDSSVSFPGQCPHAITIYKSKIYVTILNPGNVAIISNGVIVYTFPTMCSQGLFSISDDSFGYLALSCWGDNEVYIYDSNMQYMNKSIELGSVRDGRLDTNKRFAICNDNTVKIYN
jgi:hypothetical protein